VKAIDEALELVAQYHSDYSLFTIQYCRESKTWGCGVQYQHFAEGVLSIPTQPRWFHVDDPVEGSTLEGAVRAWIEREKTMPRVVLDG